MASYKLPKVSQYVKNVGRSVAFASINGITENASGIKSFVSNNDEIFKEAYSSVKNYRETIKKTKRGIRRSNLYRALEIGVKNFVEDAKSGNFYNDRMAQSEYANKLLGLDDEDTDLSFDFGSETESLSDSFNNAIGAAATSNSTAVANSTSIMVSASRANTELISTNMDIIGNKLSYGIGNLYVQSENINKFLNGPMLDHLKNSENYFKSSLEVLQSQQAMLKELLEMQRNLYVAKQEEYKESSLDSVLGPKSFNIKNYGQNIKKNFKNLMDEYGLGMLSGFDIGGGNPYLAITASLAKNMMDAAVNTLMPKDLKKSISNFDDTITSVFSQMISRINVRAKRDDDSLLSILAKVFGLSLPSTKASINTADYKKGAVPFDGLTRQTIIEVIPGYLSRIESVLTGNDERHYDLNKGTWKTGKQIQTEFDSIKSRAVANANFDAKWDLEDMMKAIEQRDKKYAEELRGSIDTMFEKIFEDGGYFHKTQSPDNITPAWQYYGFKSEKEFLNVINNISRKSINGLAYENMSARQSYADTIKAMQRNGGPSRILFNGHYSENGGDGRRHNPSEYTKGSGLLSLSKDERGRNVFWYLREILNRMGRARSSSSNSNSIIIEGEPSSTTADSGSESANTEEESSDTEEPPSSNIWEDIRKERDKQKELERNKKKLGSWLNAKLGNSAIGKFVANIVGGAGTILSKPMEYATTLLNKADENIFKLMFGDNDLRDDENNKIDSVFQYMIYKVKKTFESFKNWMDNNIFKKIKEKLNPVKDEWGEPIKEDLKRKAKYGSERTKQAFGNTIGKIFSNDSDTPPVVDSNDIKSSANGRIVTKRGLTMISPGEIIIPASFDKKEQQKMLNLEKEEKNKIIDSIGFNASGTVNIDDIKKQLKDFTSTNKDKIVSASSSGIIGSGVGLITGLNPIIGAAAGVAISLLKDNSKFKAIIFGKDVIDEKTGEITHNGGIIPKKMGDYIKKAVPDMGDFGIVGGIAGLLTPFGPLGGAAIGAGIGLLKNSETFHKFIFGNNGDDGIINEEAFNAFKTKVKNAAPTIGIGAVAGALMGPFGILGNAVMGAGLGLLSTTETFHKFVFGDPQHPEDSSLLKAINTGILQPAKEKIGEIIDNFKEYAKKNILEPMKNFWAPFNQAIKNVITTTADSIKDHLYDMFERTIGIPVHDFLQERLFKPITKIVFGVLKVPIAVGKAIVAAPLRALGGIGNSLRMGQIRRGTATDMSASERLSFREKHKTRANVGRVLGLDKTIEQDTILSNLSEADLETLSAASLSGVESEEALQKRVHSARKASGRDISKFFNTKNEDGRSRYDSVKGGKRTVDKLAKQAADGDIEGAEKIISRMKGLSDDEKEELLGMIRERSTSAKSAIDALESFRNGTQKDLEDNMTRMMGHKVTSKKELRKIYRNAEAELKARRKDREIPETASSVDLLNEANKERTEKILKEIREIQELMKKIINPNYKPGTPNSASQESKETPENDRSSISEELKKVTSIKDNTKSIINPITGLSISSNTDSKEYKEMSDKMNQRDNTDTENLNQNKKSTNILKRFYERAFGEKIDEDGGKSSRVNDDEKGGLLSKGASKAKGFFGKIASGFGSLLNFLGVGGKVAAALVGVSLFGHATEWFKTAVWPKIKSCLFGSKNEDGTTKTEGLLGGIGDKLKIAFVGEDGNSGLFGKIKTFIKEHIIDKYKAAGGLAGILSGLAEKMVAGWGLAISNVVAPLTTIIIKSLPGLFVGLCKGIIAGIKMPVFNKEITPTSSDSDVSGSINEISSLERDTSSSLKTKAGSFGDMFKNSSSNYSSGSTSSLNDMFSSFSTSSASNESAGGLMGLLGKTKRTNEIEYDENGNRITNIAQFNETDSLGSRVASSAGNAFIRGVGGSGGLSIANAMSKVGAKGFGGGIARGVTAGVGAGIKGTGKILGGANKLGLKVNSAIENTAAIQETAFKNAMNNVTDYAGQSAAMDALRNNIGDDAANKIIDNYASSGAKVYTSASKGFNMVDDAAASATGAAANGADDLGAKVAGAAADAAANGSGKSSGLISKITSSIGNFFSNFASTKIGGFILSACSKETTRKVVEGALKKIGDKIGKELVGKASNKILQKVVNAVCSKSPLVIAMIVKDFIVGYDQADTLLGVAYDANYEIGLGQKCLCGLLNAINNQITFGIISTSTILDIIVEYLFPVLGLDASSLKAAQAETAEILANDTESDNLEDHNNKNKWWYGTYSKIKEVGGGALNKVKEGASKVWGGVKDTASNVKDHLKSGLDAVSNKVSETFDNAKSIGTFLGQVTSNMAKFMKDPDYEWNVDSLIDEDDPLGGVKKTIYQVAKIPCGIVAATSVLGEKIFNKIKSFVSGVKAGASDGFTDVKNVIKGQYTIFSSDYWKFNDSGDEENPLGTLGKVSSTIFKVIASPVAMIGYVGSKIKDAFKKLIAGAKEGMIDASSDVKAVKEGQYTIFNSNYWKSDNEEDDGNPLSKIGSVCAFISRVFYAPSAMVGYIGTKIKNAFKTMISGAKEGMLDASSDIKAVKEGQYTIFSSKYWKSDKDEDDDNPLSKLGSVFAFITRLFNAPGAMIGYIGTKIKNTFLSIIKASKDIEEETDKVIDKAKEGKISVFSSAYWKMSDNVKDNPLGLIGQISSFIQRLVNAPIVIFTKVFNKIKERFNQIKGWFSKLFGEDAEEVDTKSTSSGGGRSGKGRADHLTYGSGHAYQNDELISKIRYGDSTIGKSGCAPVAAVNVVNRFNGLDNGTSIGQAAAYAEDHNMTVPGGGTDVKYFNSFLGSKGISTQNTSDKSKMLDAIDKGDQVIMLGQDKFGGRNAPFGTIPHYITAVGKDKRGNIIVEDPDLPQGTITYTKNQIMKSVDNSIIASNRRNINIRNKSIADYRRAGMGRRSRVSKLLSGMGRLYYGLGGKLGPEAIIAVAESQIGVTEEGENKVIYNWVYWGNNNGGSAYPWCCAFVWWVFNQAGASKLFYGGEKTAYCPTLKSYYEQHGQGLDKNATPEPGDIVYFNFNGGSEAVHVGIVKEVSGDKVITIEGNTSGNNQANGGCVMKKERSKSCIIGYSRPDYPYDYDESSVIDMSKYNDSTDYKSIASSGVYTGTSSSDSSSGTSATLLSSIGSLGQSMAKAIYGKDAYEALFGAPSSDDNGSGTEGTSGMYNTTDLDGSDNGEKIWNYLTSKGYNKYAAAGIMGNWMTESGLRPNNLEDGYESTLGMTDESYTDAVNKNGSWPERGVYGKDYFNGGSKVLDSNVGYGLGQWTYYSRKDNLLNFAKSRNASIDDLGMQLDFAMKEMDERGGNLKSTLNNSKSTRDATVAFLDGFEMYSGFANAYPSNTNGRVANAESAFKAYAPQGGGRSGRGRSDSAYRKNDYAKSLYNGSGKSGSSYGGAATSSLNSRYTSSPSSSSSYSTSTQRSNNSSMDYAIFLKTIVSMLMNISNNTALLTKILQVLSDNFDINIDKTDIDAAASKTKEQTEAALNELVRRSTNNNVNTSKLLNNKDTEYILAAMRAIATE